MVRKEQELQKLYDSVINNKGDSSALSGSERDNRHAKDFPTVKEHSKKLRMMRHASVCSDDSGNVSKRGKFDNQSMMSRGSRVSYRTTAVRRKFMMKAP